MATTIYPTFQSIQAIQILSTPHNQGNIIHMADQEIIPNNQPYIKVEEGYETDAFYMNCPVHLLKYMIEVVKEFSLKYLGNDDDGTIEYVLRKISMIGEQIISISGVRELVAAVLYCQYSGIIRIKPKQFSRLNQLSPKIFNRKYAVYLTMCKRLNPNSSACNTLKIEQKFEEQTKQEYAASILRMSKKQAIQLIYDGIFKSKYFQDNRRTIIQKIAQRCEEIDPRVYEQMDWTTNQTSKLYYAIYAHLKQLEMKVSFTHYRESVTRFARINIKRSQAIKTQKIFKKISSQALRQQTTSHSDSEQSVI